EVFILVLILHDWRRGDRPPPTGGDRLFEQFRDHAPPLLAVILRTHRSAPGQNAGTLQSAPAVSTRPCARWRTVPAPGHAPPPPRPCPRPAPASTAIPPPSAIPPPPPPTPPPAPPGPAAQPRARATPSHPKETFNPGAALAACLFPGAGQFLLGDRPRAACIA